MRMIVLLLLAGCTDAPWHPECVESGRAHTCSDLVPDGSGFTTPVVGDHLEITVIVDDLATTLAADPCWM